MGSERIAMSVTMLATPVPSQPASLLPQTAPGMVGLKFASKGLQFARKKIRQPTR